MSGVGVALLVLAATFMQVGVVPSLVFAAGAAPLLPVAVVAAWGTLRDPAEVWPALLLAAITLGVASEQRAGWYLLALLPTGALLLAPAPPSIARVARAALTATAGAWTYSAVLLLADGHGAALPAFGVDLVGGAMWTGAIAAMLTLALWPVRARARGLFV